MPDSSTPEWAAGLASAFTYQLRAEGTKRELENQRNRADRAEKELADLHKSRSWRVTRPLRTLTGDQRAQNRASIEGALKGESTRKLGSSQKATAREVALTSRIVTVLTEFDQPPAAGNTASLADAIAQLTMLLDGDADNRPLMWLAYIAFTARYPREVDIQRFQTQVVAEGAGPAVATLLAATVEWPNTWEQLASLELISAVVVDATSTSHRDFQTGIQRVVRESVPRWKANAPVELMIWSKAGTNFRPPTPLESWRVLEFKAHGNPTFDDADKFEKVIRVPWNTTVIVPEPTNQMGRAQLLECLGTWSGNILTAIFYDALMFVLPDYFTDETRIGLSNYIPVVRATKRVAAISRAVADDLTAFTAGFGNAGFARADIAAISIPLERRQLDDQTLRQNTSRLAGVPGLPTVLSVGSIEPRKNQLLTLRAAETLWREGLQFQLLFIGWGSWGTEVFQAEVDRSSARGRPVRIIRRADEDLLWTAYQTARFTVYASIAEGYGLPVAESLSVGTPVITTNYGSQAEIAALGGALTVNPQSLGDVIDAMRTLLTDDGKRSELAAQARRIPESTWDDYAEATWKWLVQDVPSNSELDIPSS